MVLTTAEVYLELENETYLHCPYFEKKKRENQQTAEAISRKVKSLYLNQVGEIYPPINIVTLSRQHIMEALELDETSDFSEPFDRVSEVLSLLMEEKFIYTVDGEPERTVWRRYSSISRRTNAFDFFLSEAYTEALEKIKLHPFVF